MLTAQCLRRNMTVTVIKQLASLEGLGSPQKGCVKKANAFLKHLKMFTILQTLFSCIVK